MDEQMIELIARAIAAAEWSRDARLRRLEKHPGDTAERCAERSWGLWTDHAAAAHSVIAGKVAELTEVLVEARRFVSLCCVDADPEVQDEAKSVRSVLDAALAPYPERRSE